MKINWAIYVTHFIIHFIMSCWPLATSNWPANQLINDHHIFIFMHQKVLRMKLKQTEMKQTRLASQALSFFLILRADFMWSKFERYINDDQRSSQIRWSSSSHIFADSQPTTNWQQQQFTSLFYYLSNYNRLFILISFLISLFS